MEREGRDGNDVKSENLRKLVIVGSKAFPFFFFFFFLLFTEARVEHVNGGSRLHEFCDTKDCIKQNKQEPKL